MQGNSHFANKRQPLAFEVSRNAIPQISGDIDARLQSFLDEVSEGSLNAAKRNSVSGYSQEEQNRDKPQRRVHERPFEACFPHGFRLVPIPWCLI